VIAEKDNKNSDESTQSINSLYRERTHSVGLIVAPESGAYTVACRDRFGNAKYERRRSARRSTPRHPITMASTAETPDPMPCALAAILLPESCARGCRMQKGLFPGT
jgi:hypothetical protein